MRLDRERETTSARLARRGGARTWAAGACALTALLCLLAASASAQQVTQTFDLRPGWNAIFLEVLPEPNDTATVFAALPAPVESVWAWDPRLSPADYIEDPSEAETMWNESQWLRFFPSGDKAMLTNLFAVHANRAYLVKIGGSEPVSWSVSGRPALRHIRWIPDAFNLVGFPVDPAVLPSFGAFFAFASPHRPERSYRLTPEGVWIPAQPDDSVHSGEAYWVYSEGMSDFDAPVEVILEDSDGLDYDAILEQRSLRIRNRTNGDLTVEISSGLPLGSRELAYEEFDPDAPGGFVWQDLGSSLSLPLVPGGQRVLRIGVRRALFGSDVLATVLAVRDAAGTRWRAPLRAVRVGEGGSVAAGTAGGSVPAGTPTTGLWLGTAVVNRVSEVNPPSADLRFDLALRLLGERQLCAGGADEGDSCSSDSECAGYDVPIACDAQLCNGGADAGRACDSDGDCQDAGQLVASCVSISDPTAVRSGGLWRYNADGVDPGAAWKQSDFDDSHWETGVGDFGFGNPDENEDGAPDEATTLESSCRAPCALGAAERPPTYYFRTRFELPPLADWAEAPSQIELDLLADDGAVLWLNGSELTRVNMPPGTPAFETYASTALAGDEEAPVTIVLPVDAALRFGETNVLAVEVHQHESEVVHRQLVCDASSGGVAGLNCTDDSQCGGGSCLAAKIEQVAQTTPTVFPSGGSEAQLRLIVHVDGSGQARLLKHVIQMWQDGDEGPPVVPGQYVLLTDDSKLAAFEGVAVRGGALVGRRISATAFDFADEDPSCPGCLTLAPGVGREGGPALVGTAVLPTDHPTNPYYHRYHPDHDNLSASFEPVADECTARDLCQCRGGDNEDALCTEDAQCPGGACVASDFESFAIQREIELEFTPFDSASEELNEGSLGWGDSELGGIYREVLTGLHKEPIHVEGTFRLFRPPSSRIPALNPPPPGQAGQ